jgi:hypothetical protein
VNWLYSLQARLMLRKIVSWPTLLLIALYAGNAPASECFDDKNLSKLHVKNNQNRGTLIYVWSPRMVYSVQNMNLASRAAAAAGLDFVVLHDMRVPSDELLRSRIAASRPSTWPSAAGEREPDLATPPYVSLIDSSRPLCAPQLIERDALRHFPTAFVINAQGIHPQPIVGAMPWHAWASSLDQRLNLSTSPRQ